MLASMRWVLHGNLTPAVADALVRHGHKALPVAEAQLSEASPFNFMKSAQAKQLDVITADPDIWVCDEVRNAETRHLI